MKKNKLIPVWIGLIFASYFVGGFVCSLSVEPEVKTVIEKIYISKNCPECIKTCACTPCIDEPIFDKCEMESFAYEAIVNRTDIYGNSELNKGDVYIIRDRIWGPDNEFCKTEFEDFNEDCFGAEIILDKKLFKPIK